MTKERNDGSKEPDFAQISEQLEKLDPKPEESEKDKRFDIVWKGAMTGAFVGYVVARFILNENSALGVYGDAGVVLLKTMGPGALIGAFVGWVNLHLRADNNH